MVQPSFASSISLHSSRRALGSNPVLGSSQMRTYWTSKKTKKFINVKLEKIRPFRTKEVLKIEKVENLQ